MVKEYNTISEATCLWIREFNAIQTEIIEKLMQMDPDDWSEVTVPTQGDEVYVCALPSEAGTLERHGKIRAYNKESGLYLVELSDGISITTDDESFEVVRYGELPMWGTMWSFGDAVDDWWLEEDDGIRAMSDCGFRIFHHEEFGYFWGIDGAGYNFHEEHFEPLYKARGLKWHDAKIDRECAGGARMTIQEMLQCGIEIQGEEIRVKVWDCDEDRYVFDEALDKLECQHPAICNRDIRYVYAENGRLVIELESAYEADVDWLA